MADEVKITEKKVDDSTYTYEFDEQKSNKSVKSNDPLGDAIKNFLNITKKSVTAITVVKQKEKVTY